MIIVPKREIWTQQPQYPRPIASTSTLYRPGLLAWTPSQGLPGRVGSPTVMAIAGGVGFNCTGGNYWVASTTKVVSGIDTYSILAVFQTKVATRYGGRPLLGERGSSGNDIVKLSIASSTEGVGAVIRNTAGTLVYLTHPTSSIKGNDGVLHTLILSKYSSNSFECFYDGKSISTNSTSLPGSGFTGETPLLIGYDQQDVANMDGILLAAATPGYAYSGVDAANFHRNPWQIFAP